MNQSNDKDFWRRAEKFCRERLSADPAFDISSYYFDNHLGWIELIKSLRTLRGVGLFEAQKEALENPRWRAWVIRQAQSDPRCAKEVRAHMRQFGDASLIRIPARPVD
jgi:hypothetical protein